MSPNVFGDFSIRAIFFGGRVNLETRDVSVFGCRADGSFVMQGDYGVLVFNVDWKGVRCHFQILGVGSMG